MDSLTGLVAVTMLLGMPSAAIAMYTFYRVHKLRSEERMAGNSSWHHRADGAGPH